MWNLKNKIREKTKGKETNGHKDKLRVARGGESGGLGENSKGIKNCKLVGVKVSRACKEQHRGYSQ